jgi:hypothetical protein
MRMLSRHWISLLLLILITAATVLAHVPAQSSSSSSSKHVKHPAAPVDSTLDPGTITNNLYRNKTLSLTYKIPEGWVLRTDELNAREDDADQKNTDQKDNDQKASPKDAAEKEKDAKQSPPPQTPPPASSAGAKVLLAAFSRPPEAKGEEINSSIVIAAESQSAYPGLKDAVQYLDPIAEVAKAQGFTQDEDPYEIAVGTKNLVRADFHKDVGSRVMRQSTLAFLAHGYAISITVIAGTEDEVEELIDALIFITPTK